MGEVPITVLGLGGAGCRAVGALEKLAPGRLRLLAVDTDRAALESCPIPESHRLLAAADWRGGRGCGGNVLDGQRALARERSSLETLLTGTPLLLVVGGLGGGTASGGAGIVLSVCRKLDLPALFLLTLPFTLEGHSKRRVAEETLRNELLDMADAVLTLPNDLLFSILPGTTPLAEAFALADREIAGTALALTAVLRQGNLLAVNFTDLVAVLRRRKSFCSIGVGIAAAGEAADGTGRCQLALERLLESPLLGGGDKLTGADAVLFAVMGDDSLARGATRQVLEQAGTFVRPEAKLFAGASTETAFGERVQLCALTIKFDAAEEVERPLAGGSARKGRAARKTAVEPAVEVEQLKFALDTLSKGMMDKTTPVIWNGEDLDFPTFQRRNVMIDTGKTVPASELKKQA